jgi:hypothetical protein
MMAETETTALPTLPTPPAGRVKVSYQPGGVSASITALCNCACVPNRLSGTSSVRVSGVGTRREINESPFARHMIPSGVEADSFPHWDGPGSSVRHIFVLA